MLTNILKWKVADLSDSGAGYRHGHSRDICFVFELGRQSLRIGNDMGKNMLPGGVAEAEEREQDYWSVYLTWNLLMFQVGMGFSMYSYIKFTRRRRRQQNLELKQKSD